MIEKLYNFTITNEKRIERSLDEDLAAINHMVLPQGEGLPLHNANSNVFMIVVRGTITLVLDEQEAHDYPTGSILAIPFRTRMDVRNTNEDIAEIFVVKTPGPRVMPQ